MSLPTVIYWPSSDANVSSIALEQDVTVGNSFQLCSNTPPVTNLYTFDKVIRTISITSASLDNLGASVVITGLGSPVDGDGNPTKTLSTISELIVLDGIGVFTSENIYSVINSCTCEISDITNASIGFGPTGITDYVFLDYNRIEFQTAVQIQFMDRVDTLVTVYQTLSKPEYPNIRYGNLDKFEPIPAFAVDNMEDLDENALGTILPPVAMTWANISDNSSDSLYFTVLQQGY